MLDQKRIIEGNKLLIIFMDVLYGSSGNKIRYDYLDVIGRHIDNDMYFHKRWDWLIPVIDKITDTQLYWDEYIEQNSNIVNNGKITINTKFIQDTWEEVVEFVEWYNKNRNEC